MKTRRDGRAFGGIWLTPSIVAHPSCRCNIEVNMTDDDDFLSVTGSAKTAHLAPPKRPGPWATAAVETETITWKQQRVTDQPQAKTAAKQISEIYTMQLGPGSNASGLTPKRSTVPRRKPDLEVSRKRVELCEKLSQELAKVKNRLRGFCTVQDLKRAFPDSVLWQHLSDAQVQELVDGEEFAPKAFAESLTLTHFGLTSRETLRKDRKKLRRANKGVR
jgi:hypothetical protein